MTTAAVAGTFDVIHDGHLALLKRAFEIGDRVLVGITSDKMASKGRSESIPLSVRLPALERCLEHLGSGYTVFEIDDMYGPAAVMDDADVHEVSEETLGNGR